MNICKNTGSLLTIPFIKVLKKALKDLNVGYTDACCNETFIPTPAECDNDNLTAFYPSGTPQLEILLNETDINVTSYFTSIDYNDDDVESNLIDGVTPGQLKKILVLASPQNVNIIPDTPFEDETTNLYFNASETDTYVILMWTCNSWRILEIVGNIIPNG